MNDPWDVKSVRQSGQYVSCMKFNGVPLLPPVLSKECRKEMQYYKLLAREVEKRITLLQPYIDSDNDSVTTEDKTDAPELPESEQIFVLHSEQAGFNSIIDQATEITCEKTLDNSLIESPKTDFYSCLASNTTFMDKAEDIQTTNSPKYVIDLSLHISETGRTALDSLKPSKIAPPVDLPERDYNCLKKENKREILMDTESPKRHMKRVIKEDYHYKLDKDILSDSFPGVTLNHDGPSSLSCKSFTGSLNDLNIESAKDSHIVTKLVRQSSYTLLKPSPQLLAHLEIQSINAGVEINSISMSESLSNLSSPGKKRRSWDLESAKAKWSNMALELKQKKIPDGVKMKNVLRSASKKIPQATLPRAQSVIPDKPRRGSVSKSLPKSEPVQKPKRSLSPVRKSSNRTVVKEPISPKLIKGKIEPPHPSRQLISESEDPATRVRELYEKIQKQQLIQMASLVEKQKKEQILLQQVFEEQNNMLYKQLKVICPKSPIEVKEAWVDQLSDRGPVSLSQLINQKSPDQSIYDSPVSSTLTDTNNCINHCDNVLKKSRDLSGSIKKQQQPKSRNQNDSKIQTQTLIGDGSRTRTHSPNQRFTPISRKLNYDTSASSEREYDPILTDRTNDTMADLNVTFPSDHTDEYFNSNHDNTVNNLCDKEVTVIHKNSVQNAGVHHRSTESAIKHIERILPNSKCVRNDKSKMICNPTPQQREAASKIVAHAKGFLVRRLMRTERVQGTVQTIKDALLCALQLHQDREGIRGADVDLHRRLIQQITAACYSLHDTFIASTPGERCAMIAADRGRRRSLAARPPPPKPFRQTDIMSQSHSGTFPSRAKRPSAASLMTQSNYETFSGDKCSPVSRSRYMPSPRRRPWR